MLNRIIDFSIRNKLIAILFTCAIAGFGVYAILHIPVGAVPDITNNQVQVITTSGNLSTQDIEQFITYPVELEMSNLPGVKEIRSISKFGLSVVTIVFDDDLGTYLPRQLIAEKIKNASANIPEGFGTPEMGPITTGLGEIYQYILDTKPGYSSQYSTMDLRTIQDWVVKRQLSGIPGVVEVNTWGGYLKQYEVAISPEKLKRAGISLIEVFDALQQNNSVAGGAYIEKANQSYFIRGDGLIKSLEDIERIVVKTEQGIPVLVRDLGTVGYGHANRFGAITANGEGEKVLGQIMMLKDANSNYVIDQVKKRVSEIQSTLPEGVFINPVLERSELISKTTLTVVENLLFGFIIVFFTVVLILGNIRSGLVIASLIPLSLLFTISAMYIFGIDANLMSLGALDFGIIIDGAVIIVEFISIKLTLSKQDILDAPPGEKQYLIDRVTFSGASKMMNSAVFGQLIILIVFIPILSLSGVEGKMFKPMALSFSFALLGAMILGLTWLPVASSLFLKPEQKKNKISEWIMQMIHKTYAPVIELAYSYKKVVLFMALASLILTGFIFTRIGGEFVPTLDEGDFVIQPVLKTGTSLSKTVELTTQMENILIDKFPEVNQIVSRIGAAEVPTDPMSMEEIDMIIKLHPKDEWTSAESKEELAEKFKAALMIIPGIDYEFTQPIEMRFNELITGVRADLAIKVFGEDLTILNEKAVEIKRLIDHVDGAADVILEKTVGLPQMSVRYKRDKIAYYGLSIENLNRYLAMAFGGETAGSVFEGEKRFDFVIRNQESSRTDIDNIKNLNVSLPNGNQIPLSEVANIVYATGPAKISRDNTRRRVVVSVNVRNRDLQSVVTDIQGILTTNLSLPSGYSLEYGGQFENLNNATNRLKVAVPIALLLIFIFLHFAFQSIKEAAMVFTAVPLSIVGGVVLLALRGMPFSISAGVGFVALFGIAVLNGIVLIEHLKELKKEGVMDMRERIMRGTHERLRPVLLTASAAALGFLPMAIATSAGAEVQRPLATVVIGGLITSTLLTMIMLPLLYAMLDDVTGIQLWPLKLKRKALPITLVFMGLLLAGTTVSAQQKGLTLNEAIDIAYQNNKEIHAATLSAKQSEALIPTAFSIDKTQVVYEYDQNNIADNGHPIGVIGIEQRFDFPTLYFAQRKSNTIKAAMGYDKLEATKRVLARDVSKAYYNVQYLLNKQVQLVYIDSVYANFSKAAEISYKHGDISRLDMLNAQSLHSKIKIQYSRLQHDLKKAYSNFYALLQSDTAFVINKELLTALEIRNVDIGQDPGFMYYKNNSMLYNAELSVERNRLLPDLTLSVFNGTNHYVDAKNYSGFMIGLGIPLFFGEQRAKIKAGTYASQAAYSLQLNYETLYQARVFSLKLDLDKYMQALRYYEQSGEVLSAEIIHSAQLSYKAGEIDFFRFAQSMENAIEIKLNYLDNLYEYNNIVLDINYLTLN